MDNDESYQEYADLWKRFIELCVHARLRNRPQIGAVPEESVIPHIFLQIQDPNTTQAKRDELIKFQDAQIELWKCVDQVIDRLMKNKYVRGRIISRLHTKYTAAELQWYLNGNGVPKEADCYRTALYNYIYP